MNGIGPPILKQAELIELAGETGQHQRLSQLLHIVNASFIRPICMSKGPDIGIRGKYWQPRIVNGLGKNLRLMQDPVPLPTAKFRDIPFTVIEAVTTSICLHVQRHAHNDQSMTK